MGMCSAALCPQAATASETQEAQIYLGAGVGPNRVGTATRPLVAWGIAYPMAAASGVEQMAHLFI